MAIVVPTETTRNVLGGESALRVCLSCEVQVLDEEARFCMTCGDRLVRMTPRGISMLGCRLSGRYRIFDLLADSRMSELFLAWDEQEGRQVVIKVLHPEHRADQSHRERFWRELQTQWSLQHPGIAQVYDLGYLDDGSPYMALEQIRGLSLQEIVEDRGALPEAEVIEIALQVCDALAYVHDEGFVHRDLKPDNILVTRDGQGRWIARLIDFGVTLDTARPMERLTQDGYVVGTPDYMAPEQIQGIEIDARTDVYALGAVLVLALTGVEAFTGGTPFQIVTAHLVEPVPSVKARTPSLSSLIDAVVRRALAKEPRDRVESMHALRAALIEVKVCLNT